MAEFAALPIFTDALLADTLHLTDAEFGLYMRLLVILWRSPECRIPNDKAWIAKRLGRTALAYDGEIAPIVDEFCQKDGNYIIQKRLLKEFEYIRNKSKSQSSKAKARWGNENAKKTQKNASSESVPDKPLKQNKLDLCPGDAPTPTPTPTDRDTSVSLSSGARAKGNSPRQKLMDENSRIIDADFETFWAGWRPFDMDKGSKAKARTSYDKARKETTHEHIIATRDAYLSSCHARQQRTKHAVSWLNAKGWQDDYTGNASQNGQHHNQKASYLDKITRAGEGALQLVKARLEADRHAPWNQIDEDRRLPDHRELSQITGPVSD